MSSANSNSGSGPGANPYDVLGLPADCTENQIRSAFRLLAKQYHPDVNRGSAAAVRQTQELNAAYEILGDPARRAAFDQAQAVPAPGAARTAGGRAECHVTQEIQLGARELVRGTQLEIRVIEPTNPGRPELYALTIPAGTTPGARFRVARTGPFAGGIVTVKVKVRADAQFKARGSDLRCDLRITAQRATLGGVESLRGVTGDFLRIPIPARVARGEIIRVANEGLPRAEGGRGDLLVRITYRPEVQISRVRRA